MKSPNGTAVVGTQPVRASKPTRRVRLPTTTKPSTTVTRAAGTHRQTSTDHLPTTRAQSSSEGRVVRGRSSSIANDAPELRPRLRSVGRDLLDKTDDRFGNSKKARGSSKRSTGAQGRDVRGRRCKAKGCPSQASYSVDGEKRAVFCGNHREYSMIRLQHPDKTCGQEGCTRPAAVSHMTQDGVIERFCSEHRLPKVVASPTISQCQHSGCFQGPSYGMKSGPLNFCSSHKRSGMFTIRDGTLVVATRDGDAFAPPNGVVSASESCSALKSNGEPMSASQATSSSVSEEKGAPSSAASGQPPSKRNRLQRTNRPRFCTGHKKKGMVPLKNRPCNFPGCSTRPHYGMREEGRAVYCFTHRKKGMVHLSREAMAQKKEDPPLGETSALGPGSLKGVTPSKVVASTKEAVPTKGATSAKKTALKTKEPAKANSITKKEHPVQKEPASSKKEQGSAGEQASRKRAKPAEENDASPRVKERKVRTPLAKSTAEAVASGATFAIGAKKERHGVPKNSRPVVGSNGPGEKGAIGEDHKQSSGKGKAVEGRKIAAPGTSKRATVAATGLEETKGGGEGQRRGASAPVAPSSVVAKPSKSLKAFPSSRKSEAAKIKDRPSSKAPRPTIPVPRPTIPVCATPSDITPEKDTTIGEATSIGHRVEEKVRTPPVVSPNESSGGSDSSVGDAGGDGGDGSNGFYGRRSRAPSRKALEASGVIEGEGAQLMTKEIRAADAKLKKELREQRKQHRAAGLRAGLVLEIVAVGGANKTSSGERRESGTGSSSSVGVQNARVKRARGSVAENTTADSTGKRRRKVAVAPSSATPQTDPGGATKGLSTSSEEACSRVAVEDSHSSGEHETNKKKPDSSNKVNQERMVGENDAREHNCEQAVIQTTNPDPEEPSMIPPCSITASDEETQGGSKMAEAGAELAETAKEAVAEEMGPGNVGPPLLCFEGCGRRASFGVNGTVRYCKRHRLFGMRRISLTK